jgi:alanine-synthesizing transaminase
MRFSKRTQWDTGDSELTKAHRERLAAGLPVADLTASNPTRCGFSYPPDLLSALAGPAAFDYDPNPKGSLISREAVCRYYASHGAEVKVDQLLLTTSTSEAYGYLFKLLCDPGDVILVPQPSYPLFDFLADLEVVELHLTPLIYDHGWQLDLEGLRQRITPKTRAVMLVHPNNPTGHFTTLDEAQELAAICREHGLALIVDEVFLDYPLDGPGVGLPADRSSFVARDLDILVFIVSGISKICGLPQMKAAWLAAVGSGSEEAMSRLEVISDTFLSMNAPVQRALPTWLSGRDDIQNQIRERVQLNLVELDLTLASQPEELLLINRLRVQGGWYAVLRIPATQDDEETTRELLDLGVWVHPGYFFGMGRSGWLVVSLLGEVGEFRRGIGLLVEYVQWNHKRNLTR